MPMWSGRGCPLQLLDACGALWYVHAYHLRYPKIPEVTTAKLWCLVGRFVRSEQKCRRWAGGTGCACIMQRDKCFVPRCCQLVTQDIVESWAEALKEQI
eukprot:s784_g11.t1